MFGASETTPGSIESIQVAMDAIGRPQAKEKP
jgi:hypothetical protein